MNLNLNLNMNLTLFLILLIIAITKCSNIFPIYSISVHQTPLLYKNETLMKTEEEYFEKMNKASTNHILGSVGTLALSIAIFPPLVPINAAYLLAHVGIKRYSYHMKRTFKFMIEEDYKDNKYDPSWIEKVRLPNWITQPTSFIFLFILFLNLYSWLCFSKMTLVQFLLIGGLMIILFLYTFSFIQHLNMEILKYDEYKKSIRKQIKWGYNEYRASWTQIELMRLKSFFSWFGGLIINKKSGYMINNDIRKLESEIYKSVSMINIFIKTITSGPINILGNILDMISFVDKFILLTFFTLILFVLYVLLPEFRSFKK